VDSHDQQPNGLSPTCCSSLPVVGRTERSEVPARSHCRNCVASLLVSAYKKYAHPSWVLGGWVLDGSGDSERFIRDVSWSIAPNANLPTSNHQVGRTERSEVPARSRSPVHNHFPTLFPVPTLSPVHLVPCSHRFLLSPTRSGVFERHRRETPAFHPAECCFQTCGMLISNLPIVWQRWFLTTVFGGS